ncbi:MAG: hypothetical protein ACKVT1_10985 [Dehalococcoidia bacterium]
MACTHPLEERRLVYEATATARTDRLLCALCGELVYAPSPAGVAQPAKAPTRAGL